MTTVTGYRTRWRSPSRIELKQISFSIFVVLLLLLPLEQIIGPMLTAPADAALMALIAVFWPVAWVQRRRVVFPLLLPMWLIFAASSLATLFSIQPTTNIVAMIQELYLYLWFVSAVNLLAWLGEGDMHRLNKIWIIVAGVESLLTLMGMLRIGPKFLYLYQPLGGVHKHQFQFEGVGRALGTFRNSNAAGGYLMASFFVLMATPWPRHSLQRLAVGGWLFLGIYATGSNASLGGALAGLAFYLLYRVVTQGDRRVMRLWITLGTLMAAVGVALPVVGFSFSSALQPGAGGALLAMTVGRLAGSIGKRVVIFSAGWDIFSHNMLGVGPNGASEVLGGGSLHNDYLAFLAERGTLGLTGLVLLMVLTTACVVASVRLSHGDRVRQLQAMALGGGFVAYFVNAMAHEVTHFRSLWLLMAMVFAYYYMLRERASKNGRNRVFGKNPVSNFGKSL
jgi:hypothetical protein